MRDYVLDTLIKLEHVIVGKEKSDCSGCVKKVAHTHKWDEMEVWFKRRDYLQAKGTSLQRAVLNFSDWYKGLHHFFTYTLSMTPTFAKWKVQRMQRGWSDGDVWGGIDAHVASIIVGGIDYLLKRGHLYHDFSDVLDQDERNALVDRLIESQWSDDPEEKAWGERENERQHEVWNGVLREIKYGFSFWLWYMEKADTKLTVEEYIAIHDKVYAKLNRSLDLFKANFGAFWD